jgi:superfamily I DNA/RNA helicase
MLPEAQYAALYALACGMSVEEAWAEVAQLLPPEAPPEPLDTGDLVAAMARTPGQVAFVSGQEELQRMLSHPFAAWRTFLHPSQRKIAHQAAYSGPAQVTGGAGTGKTVTALHRAAFLAERAGTSAGAAALPEVGPTILLTTFTRNLADALDTQLGLLTGDRAIRDRVEVLNVDRLAYRIVRQARGAPDIIDGPTLRQHWADAAAEGGHAFTSAFLGQEWEQVILAQDLRSEQAYLTCLRTGRGRPLTKAQRRQVWQAAERVRAELSAVGRSSYPQLASEAAGLLRETGRTLYQHVIIDEAQDLHPAQWRLLRAAVPVGADDLFIAADPHQRIYDSRVSLASLGIQVRGRSRRLTVNYRTTQEILAWAVPLLGPARVMGLDGEADTLLGYHSPVRGRRPEVRGAATRREELNNLIERIRAWLDSGIEPHAIGVAARAGYLAGAARDALKAAGIPTVSLATRRTQKAVRTGTMHGMKGLEFQAVAVIGVEPGVTPSPSALTPATEDALAHAQDLQRERCLLFVACTRARDHLYVSYSGEPCSFLASSDISITVHPVAAPSATEGRR